MRFVILFALFFSLIGELTALPAQTILIRHGEKPAKGNSLSPKGRERAAALVPFFLTNPRVLQFGTPCAIYAEKPSSSGSRVRPLETIAALAQALNLTPLTHFKTEQTKLLADEIMTNPAYQGKMVLICWEHENLPKIAAALGATSAPRNWKGSVYDDVWMLTYEPYDLDGCSFTSFSQELLYGDSK